MIKRTTVVLLLALVACKSPEQKAAEQTAKTLDDASKQMAEATKNGQVDVSAAMNAMGAAMGAANGGKKVETVDYKILKEMLPADVGGLKRTDASGEKTAAMGMEVSNATGTYSDGQSKNATIKITDIGSMTGLAGMASYAWAATEMNRESDNGYEKTSMFNGYKSHEKWDKSSNSGELSVLVGGRFVAEASGYGIDMNALKDALTKIDLKKLDSMKGQGVSN